MNKLRLPVVIAIPIAAGIGIATVSLYGLY